MVIATSNTKTFWGRYGYNLANVKVGCAVACLTLIVNLAILLASRMWAQELETDVNKLWINPASKTGQNLAYVDKFANQATKTEAELFSIAAPNSANVATPANMAILQEIEQKMMDTVVKYNGTRYTIYDLCVGASSQSPYTHGCNWLNPMDYFSEGVMIAPVDTKAQFVLDGNLVYGSPSAHWSWTAAADALGGLRYFGRVFADQCVNTGLIFCKDREPGDLPAPYNLLTLGTGSGSLLQALNDEIQSSNTPIDRKLRAAWIKAKTLVIRMMQRQNAPSGAIPCADLTAEANSKPPSPLDVSLAPCGLQPGVNSANGDLCPSASCNLADMAAHTFGNFSTPCGKCVAATIYWMRALQVTSSGVASAFPTSGLPSAPSAGYLSVNPIFTSTSTINQLFSEVQDGACGVAVNTASAIYAKERNFTASLCLDVFEADHAMAMDPSNTYIANSRTIKSLFESSAAALARDPTSFLNAFSTKSERDAAWRNVLSNGATPGDLGKFVNRHRSRASLAGATTDEAVLRILSGIDNDFSIVQNATRAIFGGMEPDIDKVVSGKCVCNGDYSGDRCQIPFRDGLCDCGGTSNGGFPPTCVTSVFKGCFPYASCATFDNIAKVVGLSQLWDTDVESKDAMSTFQEEAEILSALNVSQVLITDYLEDRCMDQAPCAGKGSASYPYQPTGFDRLANDTGYFLAHSRDLFSYPTISTVNRALYLIRGVLHQGTVYGGALDSTAMAALTTGDVPGLAPAEWDAFKTCMVVPTNVSSSKLRECGDVALGTPVTKPVTCNHLPNAQLTTMTLYFQCVVEIAHGNTDAGHLLPRDTSKTSPLLLGPNGNCTSDMPRVGLSLQDCQASLVGLAAMNAYTIQQRGVDVSVLVTGKRYPIKAFAYRNYRAGRHAYLHPYALQLPIRQYFRSALFGGLQSNVDLAVSRFMVEDCVLAKAKVPITIMAPEACESGLKALDAATKGSQAAKDVIGYAMIKYKLTGVVIGNCATNALSSITGGAKCWKDADCTDSAHGTCVGLANASPLTKINAMAFILFTNNAEGMVAKLASSGAVKYREEANAPILARHDAATGRRRRAEDEPEHLGAHDLTVAQAQALGRMFRIELEKLIKPYESIPSTGATTTFLSSARVGEVIGEVSEASSVYLIIGYVLMLVYAALSLSNFSTDVPHMLISSRALVGVSGVVLVAIAVASGLGLSALIGLKWSAAATQILPFIMLGLGVNDMFVMLRTMPLFRTNVTVNEALAKCLSMAGPGMMTAGITNAAIFAIATLTGMPVVVTMAIQAVLITIANYTVNLGVMPILLTFDYRRQGLGRADLAPCVSMERSERADNLGSEDQVDRNCLNRSCTPLYSRWILSKPGKALSLLTMISFVIAGAVGVTQTTLGLALYDVAPSGSSLQKALYVRDTQFNFSPFFMAYSEADFSTKDAQQGMKVTVDDMNDQEHVMDNSGIPWILAFMAWGLPTDVPQYPLDQYGRVCDPLSTGTSGKCGAKVNCTVFMQDESVLRGRIPYYLQGDFYRCLEEWMNSDLNFELLGPGFKLVDATAPKGSRKLAFSVNDTANNIFKLPFAQTSFFATGLVTNDAYVALIEESNAVCSNSTPPTFPGGSPINFWDQYVTLELVINSSIGFALLICLCVSAALLMIQSDSKHHVAKRLMIALWGAMMVVSVVVMSVYELYGFMGYFGIKISAIPAISIIMSLGFDVSSSAYIVFMFCNTRGSRDARVRQALDIMMTPVFDGAATALLGVAMLAASPLQFIVKYFFLVWLLIVFFCVMNAVCFLPVILSLVGPPSMLDDDGVGGDEAVGMGKVDKKEES